MHVLSQYNLYSRLEVCPVKQFKHKNFLFVQKSISKMLGEKRDKSELESVAGVAIYWSVAEVLNSFSKDHFEDLDVPMTKLATNRAVSILTSDKCQLKLQEVWNLLIEIETRLMDEIESHGKFFYIPLVKAQIFDKVEPFGASVSRKFPRLVEDIQEAAKCYACARYTACIFHLMRIMEHGVQRLGRKLQVNIDVDNATWQPILDRVNSAIKPMNHKLRRTQKLAEIAGHLYNVKVAWRNNVMHPKSTYTEEQAENLLGQVALFMQSLAAIV